MAASLRVTDEDRRLAATYRAPLPPIGTFIDDPFYLGLGDQCCPTVRRTLEDLFDPDASYNEAALVWGIGAGKSFLVSVADAYIVYRALCLRDPQGYYGFAPGTTLSVVNFSVTATQAHKVVFGEVAARIDASPAFQLPGFQRDKRVNSELRWPDSNLVIFPGNSQAQSAIGYNLLAAVVDEASFLPEVDNSVRVAGEAGQYRYDAAEELYNAIAKRVASRGNARYKQDALFCMISSPRYVDDFMERKAAESEHNPRIYHSRLPTWQGYPALQLSGPTFEDPICGAVPVEFQDQFTRNPEKARRDLGAVPSEAIGGFFGDPAAILAHANHDRENPLTAEGELQPGLRGDNKPPLRIHVDLGLKRDACGIAAAYRDATTGNITLLFSKRITPAEHGGEIDFARVRDFILRLRDEHGWRIASVTFDGWQSVDSRQQLRREGLTTDELSVDRDTRAYDTLKEYLLTGRLDYYPDPYLVQELQRLELVKGRKVDHPPNGSKDVADAVAGAVMACAAKVNRYAYLDEDDDEGGNETA